MNDQLVDTWELLYRSKRARRFCHFFSEFPTDAHPDAKQTGLMAGRQPNEFLGYLRNLTALIMVTALRLLEMTIIPKVDYVLMVDDFKRALDLYDIAERFKKRGSPYLVIEKNPKSLQAKKQYALGDAADIRTLQKAWIEKAHAALITTHDDATNICLTKYLSSLRPEMQILSLANLERNVSMPFGALNFEI